MKQDVTEYLERLGLSELEAKIYISLLKNGTVNARDLVLTSGVRRGSVYNGLNLLIEKGLVTKLESGTQTLFEANQPKEILPYLVQQKVQAGREVADSLPLMLNTLDSLAAEAKAKTSREVEIKYVKGKPAVRKIYEEALQATELRSYANLSIMEGVFPENLHLFSDAFKNNTDLKMYEIVEDSAESRKQTAFSSKNPRYFYKFLPKETELSAADILIYDGKVAIINVRGQITGVVLQNSDYHSSSKELFDLHWKDLPEVER